MSVGLWVWSILYLSGERVADEHRTMSFGEETLAQRKIIIKYVIKLEI